ncbi:hypothetical protein [uncultured Amnibacterium sp.]|uniref:hypothetical protein n=1 Tax=uncultured Amnibacterium sp. TaxID=1631851 RepID=UPI0035CC6E44
MGNETRSGPIMDGSDDATDEQKLAGLREQVEHDRAGEGEAAKADELRDRMAQTEVEPEESDDPPAGS